MKISITGNVGYVGPVLLERLKFDDGNFRNSQLIRLKVIAAHCEQGRLNSRLEWQ